MKNKLILKKIMEVLIMPKTYSDKERKLIISGLRDAAKEYMVVFGIKKTTVDELVKKVGIPKGTFYLFYKSKEELFYEVIEGIHDDIQNKALKDIAAMDGNLSVEGMVELFMGLFNLMDESNLINLMVSGEMDILMRKLPDEVVKKHHKKDDFSIEKMLAIFPKVEEKDVKVFSGAFRAVVMTVIYRREIGTEIYDDVLRLMIHGLILQIMEGK